MRLQVWDDHMVASSGYEGSAFAHQAHNRAYGTFGSWSQSRPAREPRAAAPSSASPNKPSVDAAASASRRSPAASSPRSWTRKKARAKAGAGGRGAVSQRELVGADAGTGKTGTNGLDLQSGASLEADSHGLQEGAQSTQMEGTGA